MEPPTGLERPSGTSGTLSVEAEIFKHEGEFAAVLFTRASGSFTITVAHVLLGFGWIRFIFPHIL